MSAWACGYLWHHFTVASDGSIRPCCRFGGDFGARPRAEEAALEILNSPDFVEVRGKMLSGAVPKGCEKCAREEAAGMFSLRQKALRDFPPPTEAGVRIAESDISYVEVFLGNTCNLKCVTCDAAHSSSILNEQRAAGMPVARIEALDLSLIRRFAGSLRVVKILGGEPFLIPQHLELLRLLNNEGDPRRIVLRYSTNGTVFPSEEVLHLWKNFERVVVDLSVDGIGPLNEYIRFPSKWRIIERSAQKYIDLSLEMKNFMMAPICTLSAYNLHGLASVVEWWSALTRHAPRLSRLSVNLNFVEAPDFLSAHVLPTEIIEEACVSLQERSPHVAETVKSYVRAADKSELLDRFRSHTLRLDNRRGTSILAVAPHLRSIFERASS